VKDRYRFFDLGDVTEDGGKVRHKNLQFGPYFSATGDVSVVVAGVGKQVAGHDRKGKLEFAARPKDAPVIHFNGPLTLDLFHDQQPLRTGQHEDLSVVVGTRGVGPGTFAVLHCEAYPDKAWLRRSSSTPGREGGRRSWPGGAWRRGEGTTASTPCGLITRSAVAWPKSRCLLKNGRGSPSNRPWSRYP